MKKSVRCGLCVRISSWNVRKKNKNEIFIWHQFEINDFLSFFFFFCLLCVSWKMDPIFQFSSSTSKYSKIQISFLSSRKTFFLLALRFTHVGELHWESLKNKLFVRIMGFNPRIESEENRKKISKGLNSKKMWTKAERKICERGIKKGLC